MKKLLLVFIIFLGSVVHSNATYITTSAAGTLFEDNYSYTFVITDDSSDSTIFHATLTNTSSNSDAGALIDLLAFNIKAKLGTDSDFTITDVAPDWTFSAPSGSGVKFDYLGDAGNQGVRLSPGNTLTFNFDFVDGFTFPLDPFEVWTTTSESLGTGIGGGTDSGQVAVSFQQLGLIGASDPDGGTLGKDGDGSDLLASNWTLVPDGGGGGGGGNPVPEPATFMLLGFGLLGLAGLGRKKMT